MFCNLNAEQARHGDTNQSVADYLGISRNSYENKKKSGKFTVPEIMKLCKKYSDSFDYLFEAKDNSA